MADSAAALMAPDDFAQGYSRLVAENGALFGSRMYRHYTWLLSLSDHIAHFGLEHHESSDDRADENALSEPDLRMDVAELLGHEYVHSWNGKYRRPQGLLSPDFQKPMDGSLLWVYEGMTEFWGEVLPTRAGLITPEFFHETLAEWRGLRHRTGCSMASDGRYRHGRPRRSSTLPKHGSRAVAAWTTMKPRFFSGSMWTPNCVPGARGG